MTCLAHQTAKEMGRLHEDDVDLIIAGARMLDSNSIVVDLGIGFATASLAAFEGGCEKIYGIDKRIKSAQEIIGRSRFRDQIALLEGDFNEVSVPEEAIHMLLIDCDHSYEGTKAALERWLPKVVREGRVWVHDYNPPADVGWPQDPSPGVRKAVDELIGAGELETIDVRGLGWLGIKTGEQARGKLAEADSAPKAPEPSSESAEPPETPVQDSVPPATEVPSKRKSGRPKGSKNKSKGQPS